MAHRAVLPHTKHMEKKVARGGGPPRETPRHGSRARCGQRFTLQQHAHAVKLLQSGMRCGEVAALIGTTTQSLRRWVEQSAPAKTPEKQPAVEIPTTPTAPALSVTNVRDLDAATAAAASTRPVGIARDAGQGLSAPERAAILDLKKKHPSYGPAQIRVQLRRFWGWRVSIKAIAKVLVANGYELVWKGSRPRGEEPPIRFEAPRPNAMWQMDFAELHLAGEKLHLLVALDDYSRFVVGHALADSPSSAVPTAVLRRAMARHGKPESVRTDRGGAFLARVQDNDFARVLEAELIDHIVGRPYHPQGGGKVEALIGTLRRELWDVEQMADRTMAERRITAFFEEYNHRRAHMGIGGLAPADRYHGRTESVLATVDAVARGRQGAAALQAIGARTVEEVIAARAGAPLEVVRLVLRDGVMELCFCGARVTLGSVMC